MSTTDLTPMAMLDAMKATMDKLDRAEPSKTWLLMSPKGELFVGTPMDMLRILAINHDPLDRLANPAPSTTPASHPYRRRDSDDPARPE